MSFSDDIRNFVSKTQNRMIAVFRTSASFLHEEISDRTPVDTGFLRASLSATLNEPVYMDGTSGEGTVALSTAALDDAIYIGFTMRYARRIEYGFVGADSLGRSYNQQGAGMMRLSAQNWQDHVKRAVAAAKAEVKQ